MRTAILQSQRDPHREWRQFDRPFDQPKPLSIHRRRERSDPKPAGHSEQQHCGWRGYRLRGWHCPVRWLTATDPSPANVVAGQSSTFTVSANPAGLAAGTYTALPSQ